MGDLTIWNVLVVLILPAGSAAFGLVWARLNRQSAEVWGAINGLRQQHADHKLDCERRYVPKDSLAEFKAEMLRHFERLEQKLDKWMSHGNAAE